MIQSVSNPAAATAGSPLALLSMTEPADGETALFSALLDEFTGIQTSVDELTVLPEAAETSVQAALPVAETASRPGNTLPPVLPVAQQAPALEENKPETPAPIHPRVPPKALRSEPSPATQLSNAPHAASPKSVGHARKAEGAEASPRSVAPPALSNPGQTATAMPVDPRLALALPEQAQGEPRRTASAPANRTIPQLPETASQQAVAQMERHRASQGEQPSPQRPENAVLQSPISAAPAEEVRLDIAVQNGAGAPGQASVQPPSPALVVRPMEFAALIERLTMARESVSSQAVSITVAHQDFGPVRLHFRPDELSMAVTMSSADPDFARAAAAAPIPVLPVQPVQPSEQPGNAPQHRGEGASTHANSQGHGSSQSRSGPSDHRDPQRSDQPRQQDQLAGAARGLGKRGGIFA